jgi:hypothetical protein
VFVPGMLFQPSLMFVSNSTSKPYHGAPERCSPWVGLTPKHYARLESPARNKHFRISTCSTLGKAPSLNHKQYAILEKPERNKHSSLLGPYVSYEENRVLSPGPERI